MKIPCAGPFAQQQNNSCASETTTARASKQRNPSPVHCWSFGALELLEDL